MEKADCQHLAWSLGKAFKALSALAANSGEFREHLHWAVDELSVIPRVGLPEHICEQLRSIDARMFAEYRLCPPAWPYTVVYKNISKIRGKKRVQLAEDVILVCMDISEACGSKLKGFHS